MKEKLMVVTEESDKNGYESSVWFDKEDSFVYENEFLVVLEDTCLNQDRRNGELILPRFKTPPVLIHQ